VQQIVLPGNAIGGECHALEWSPDGRQLGGVVGRTLFVWDRATQALILNVTVDAEVFESEAAVRALRFHFSEDGSLCGLLSHKPIGAIRVWSCSTGEEATLIRIHGPFLIDFAFSQKSLHVALLHGKVHGFEHAGDQSHSVVLHHVSDHSIWHSAMTGRGTGTVTASSGPENVVKVRFTPLASGKNAAQREIRDAETFVKLAPSWQGNIAAVAYSRRSEEGSKIRVALFGTARGSSVADMDVVGRSPRSIAISSNGLLLAVGRDNGEIELWDTITGARAAKWELRTAKVARLSFSPSGSLLAVGNGEGTVLVGDLKQTLATAAQELPSLHELWGDLGSPESRRATLAVFDFARHGDEATAWIRTRLIDALSPKTAIDDAIADLDEDDFERRERATEVLEDIGTPCEESLRNTLAGSSSAEVRMRCRRVLASINTNQPSPRLRRAAAALELMATAEALSALQDLRRVCRDQYTAEMVEETIQRFSSSRR
jgi:WD40 repeat protein